jgi:hypothetical protein
MQQPSYITLGFDEPRINFSSPTLDIDAYYITEKTLVGSDWQDPDTGKFPFNNPNNARFIVNEQEMDRRELQSRAQCQSRGVTTYKWGFSFVLLFVFVLLMLLWLLASALIYIESYRIADSRDLLKGFGGYSAIVRMALCLQDGMALPLEHVGEMSETMICDSVDEEGMMVEHKVDELELVDGYATDGTDEEIA